MDLLLFTEHVIPLEDGDVTLHYCEDPELFPQDIFTHLYLHTFWEQHYLTLYGKQVKQPRMVSLFGEHPYSYSGLTLYPHPTPTFHKTIWHDVEEVAGCKFNSLLMNLYMDGSDYIGYHADDEPELGEKPVIATMAFGVERPLLFKHKFKDIKPVSVDIPQGGILVMKGDTQKYWKHSVPKSKKITGPRISLTFRNILTDKG